MTPHAGPKVNPVPDDFRQEDFKVFHAYCHSNESSAWNTIW